MKGFIEILSDIVKNMKVTIKVPMDIENNLFVERENPKLNFLFGNAQYIKEQLDIYSKAELECESNIKFPLVALFTPINESRSDADAYSSAKLTLMIACSSSKEWSNERRLDTSFKNVLIPIYESLLKTIKEDNRLDVGYDEVIKHEYSENYSYGRYGAYTESGEAMSEPIDAINIRSMELKIKNFSCR